MTPSRRARAARLAPAYLLLAPAFLLLAACGDGGDPGAAGADRDTSAETVLGDPPEASGFPAGWSAPPLDWDRCDDPSGASPEGGGTTGAMQCATLEVPLDWALPDGEQIELTLARRLATGTRIGSLLTNPGGPGGSGVDFLAAQPLGAELHESFDVVSWDPRGVGRSTGLDCDDRADDLYAADPTPDDAGEAAAIEEVAAGIASDCAESGGDLLAHMNTEEVARDLEAIRLALGGEKLNYLGFSYGTHIGQEYAELFGDRVRAMALDGVVDPSLGFEDFLLGQAEAFEAAFGRQADACASAGIASCGVEDLGAAYDTVLRAAESAAPGTTTADGGAEPTPAEVALAATYTGYLPEGWRQLGPALSDALDGEPGPLRSLAASYVSLADYGPYAAVVCTDSAPPEGFEAYESFTGRAVSSAPRFGASIANEMLPCAVWPVSATDTAQPLTAEDAPPLLVVGNTGDPATPLENARSVADAMASATLLVVEEDGHVAHGSNRCATQLIDRYLVELALPDPGTRC